MRIAYLIIPAAIAVIAVPASAQSRNWQTIGERSIEYGIDRDKIELHGNTRHRQVRICAVRRDFKLLDADVNFANGGEQDISESRTIRAGTCTRAVDLRGDRRDITNVKLFHSRFNRGRAPLIRIQAR